MIQTISFSIEWELAVNDKTFNGTERVLVTNPSIVDCGYKNIAECLNSGRHLQLKTSLLECARACKGLVSTFMFGSNESDISRCNEQGCICSCGQNIIDNSKSDQRDLHGFDTYQYSQEEAGRSLQV